MTEEELAGTRLARTEIISKRAFAIEFLVNEIERELGETPSQLSMIRHHAQEIRGLIVRMDESTELARLASNLQAVADGKSSDLIDLSL